MRTLLLFPIIYAALILQGCIAVVGGGEVGTVKYTSDDLLRDGLYYEMPKKDLSTIRRGWRDEHFKKHDVELEWGSPLEIT